MRWLLAVCLSAGLSFSSSANADEFPYKAVIKKADAQLRSGPGKNYYITDPIEEGATVEVYRHDPGNWCAIKPPDGSFSWVRARYLVVGEENTATINADDVVARTGSSVVESRDVIQVHLEKGEVIDLIDGDEEKPGSWRKISPPAGEFRWISADSLERVDEPVTLTAHTVDASKKVNEVVRAEYDEDGAPILATEDGAVEEENRVRSRRRRLSHTALQQEIIDIDLELSTRATQEMNTWEFDDLIERAERALDGAPTALDRSAVRELMAKIDRFERLCERHADVQIAQLKQRSNGQLASRLVDPQQPMVDTSRFDGTGRLARVVSKQPNAPQFALVDATGKVQYYINASPGINLQPFLNKEVGVNGTRGAIAAKQRQVLNAQRITELPGTKRF
jgi:uncharacterized protein YraI